MEQAQRLAHVLLQSTRQISEAMPRLRSFGAISHYTVEVNRLENAADSVHRRAMAELFKAGNDPLKVMKWRDILDGLESATDRCEDVANILEGVVLEYA